MTGGVLGALLMAAAAGAVLPAGRGAAARLGGTGPPPHRTGGMAARARPVLRRRRGRRAEWELRAQVGELLLALAAELRGGADPRSALAAAAADLPLLRVVATAARLPAGDVARALDEVAARAGGQAAAGLAVAWRVAERTGCGLADPVARLHGALRAEEAVRREVAAQLAGPLATARLLAGLPVLGVLLGTGLGADPLGFLLGSPAGRTCLVAGAALSGLGLVWTRRIAAGVLPPERR